jgi:hypothetical protein
VIPKIKKSDWRAIIMLILLVQIICLWSIDVSTSAIIAQKSIGDEYESYLTNGFFKQNPFVVYHLALFLIVISSFIFALISIHQVDKNEV